VMLLGIDETLVHWHSDGREFIFVKPHHVLVGITQRLYDWFRVIDVTIDESVHQAVMAMTEVRPVGDVRGRGLVSSGIIFERLWSRNV
jgi:hypothetical protein